MDPVGPVGSENAQRHEDSGISVRIAQGPDPFGLLGGEGELLGLHSESPELPHLTTELLPEEVCHRPVSMPDVSGLPRVSGQVVQLLGPLSAVDVKAPPVGVYGAVAGSSGGARTS